MAFDAQQKTISMILSGDFRYTIPRYQRRYVWEEKQWRELLDDLQYCLSIDGEEQNDETWSHFLGSFVFEQNKKDLVVIDGQQRLTTIIMMLCAICTLFNELNREDLFKGVKKYILGTDDLGADYSRVDNDELKNFQLIVYECTTYNRFLNKQRLFEDTYLENSPKDNVNVKKCFLFFYNAFQTIIESEMDKIDTLLKIRNKIIELDVIDIKATNQQESYNIFEILNARGVELKSHELIKNYIFKYIRPKSNIDTAKIQWDGLEKILFVNGKSVIDLFFNHYVTHKYIKPDKDNSEFRIIKSKCKKDEMSFLLSDLCNKAKIYRWFYIPDECNNLVIKEVLSFFNGCNHRQFRPIFLSLISANNKQLMTENELEQVLIFLKNFYFAFGMVCNGTSNIIENIIYSFAVKIETNYNADLIPKMSQQLSKYYPDFKRFESLFKVIGYSNKIKLYHTPSKKKTVQYILRSFEEYYQSSNRELTVGDFSIEHIGNDNGEDSHCQIGNLLPLSQPINNNAEDKTFTDKLTYYKQSNYITIKKFLERYGAEANWKEDFIIKRAKYMAKLAYENIWKLK